MAGDGCVEVAGVEGAGEADDCTGFDGTVCDDAAGGCVFCCMGAPDCGGGGGGAEASVGVGVGIGFSVPGVGTLGSGRSEDVWLSVSRRRFVPLEEDSFRPSEVALMSIWCLIKVLSRHKKLEVKTVPCSRITPFITQCIPCYLSAGIPMFLSELLQLFGFFIRPCTLVSGVSWYWARRHIRTCRSAGPGLRCWNRRVKAAISTIGIIWSSRICGTIIHSRNELWWGQVLMSHGDDE